MDPLGQFKLYIANIVLGSYDNKPNNRFIPTIDKEVEEPSKHQERDKYIIVEQDSIEASLFRRA